MSRPATLDGAGDGSVVGGLAFVIGSLDPFSASTAGALAVLSHVHDTLLHRDVASGQLSPGILSGPARAVAAGRYRLGIDPQARFQDGTAVTADDVAASLQRLLDNKLPATLVAGALEGMLEARATGAGQVTLTTDARLAMLDQRLAAVRVVPVAALQDPNRTPWGTGPFGITSADAGQAVLARAPGYRLGDPATRPDQIQLVALPDADERAGQLLAGELDAIEDPAPHWMSDVARNDAFKTAWLPGLNMTWLMFNCADPQLSDGRVRRAVALAVNREELARRVHGGRLTPSSRILPQWHPDAVRSADPTTDHDAARSRELLQAAGHGDGLELDLLVSSASWVERQAGLVVEQLGAVGVSCRVRVAHTAELFASDIPAGRFQMLLASGDPSSYGSDGEFILRWYLSGQWARQYCHVREPDVLAAERLLSQLVRESRPDSRRSLLGQLQALAAEVCSMTVLGHRAQPTAWSARLEGFRPRATTGLDLRTARRRRGGLR